MEILWTVVLLFLCFRLDADGFLRYTDVDIDLTGGKDHLHESSIRTRRHSTIHNKYSYNLVKHSIREAKSKHAVCLDGTEAVFYTSRKTKPDANWIVRLQAGGSCGSSEDCNLRSKGPFGSSKDYNTYVTGTFVISDDPRENPTFASWNKAFIPYCTGDVFVGRKPSKDHPFHLNMCGHFVVKAVMQQLREDFNITGAGRKILFGGASAGGLGMLANIDFVQKLMAPVEVKGYNDGGWFTLYPNFGEKSDKGPPNFFNYLSYMFNHLWDGFVDETCRLEMPRSAACLYGELVFMYLSTPIYVMVAQWDSFQLLELVYYLFNPVRLPPEVPDEARYISRFGKNTHRSLRRLLEHPTSGVFSPACFMHTFSGVNASRAMVTTQYTIKGKTAYKALSEWFINNRGTYVEVPSDTPACNPTCCSEMCALCKQSEVITDEKTTAKQQRIYLENGTNLVLSNTLVTLVAAFSTIIRLYIGWDPL